MDETPRMTPRERLVFASGDIFGGGGGALLNVLYLFFLTDVTGLAPGLAGAILGTAKVVDALSKPVMGQLTDNTRTRLGRRRPWLLAGGPLVLVASLLLWFPITGGPVARGAWSLLTALLWVLVASMVNVPYASMSTETTTSQAERTRLNLLRLGFSTVASAVVFIGATGLVRAAKAGSLDVGHLYLVLGVGFGLLFSLPVLSVGLFTRERTPVPTTREHFRLSTYLRGFRLPAFRSLLGMYLCAMLTMDAIGYLLLAFTTYAVRLDTALFMGVLIVVNLVFVVASQRLVRTMSKNVLYGGLLPLAVVAGAGIGLWPGSWPTWPVYLLTVAFALGMAGAQMMSWVMFPDVVDAAELAFGERMPGSFNGLMALLRSLLSATMVAGIGVVLQLSDYRGSTGGAVVEQPGSAVWGIRICLTGTLVLLLGAGWLISRGYPLTREACVEQTQELLRRRRAAGEAAPGETPVD